MWAQLGHLGLPVGEGKLLSTGEALPHHPGVDCRWYKDGALLTPGGKYRPLSDARSGLLVLEIRAASKEDLGHYECEVRWAGTGGGGAGAACLGDPSVVTTIHDL